MAQGNWVPNMNIPMMGIGLVQQQSGTNVMAANMVSHNSGMLPQMPPVVPQGSNPNQWYPMPSMVSGNVGMIGNQMIRTQQPMGSHQQQQMWMEANKKLNEEQRKQYEQMLKQRQFHEQKEKLKAFGATKPKDGVSADKMIQNILGPGTSSTSHKPTCIKKETTTTIPTSTSNSLSNKQSSAADWSSLNNLDNLFAPVEDKEIPSSNSQSIPNHNPTPVLPPHPQKSQSPNSVPLVTNPVPQNNAPSPPVPNVIHGPLKSSADVSLPLPQWLMEGSDNFPEIYKKASDLVAAPDGWVDTSRSYILLMKTGLHPQLLGVLWEMVNRSTPGFLRTFEFHALLALVALVQSGHTSTTIDALLETTKPILPKIDHPVLLPYYEKHQNSNNESTNDDEFDDFVSVESSNNVVLPTHEKESSQTSFFQNTSASTFQNTPAATLQSSFDKSNAKLSNPVDKLKHMNLPELGSSPRVSPDASFDDFNDFQSASDTVPAIQSPPAIPPVPLPIQSKSTEDKYDVFRQLENRGTNKEDTKSDDDFDDSFGDFCSSRPITNNAPVFQPPIKEEAKPIEDPPFVADFSQFTSNVNDTKAVNPIDVAWNDPFGEFSEAPQQSKTNTLPSFTVDDDDDDDFGDFMGPTDSPPFPPRVKGIAEGLGETQSIASLELPGLEVTVQSEGCDTSSEQSPDSFMTAKSDFTSGIEEKLGSLTIDPPPSGNLNDNLIVNTTSSYDTFSSGLADKYSSIREEVNKECPEEAHTESWQKCLEKSVTLLGAASHTLESLEKNQMLLNQVLETSQMRNYLINIQQVWGVCNRIKESSRRVTTSARVDELLALAHTLWAQILTYAEDVIDKDMLKDVNGLKSNEPVCGVCLSGGDVSLSYGGHSYHAPCANLWLNCVDLTLPSLTPVTLL